MWLQPRSRVVAPVRPHAHPPLNAPPTNQPNTNPQVVGNAEAVDRLKIVARDGNMPHMMLAGPPVRGAFLG